MQAFRFVDKYSDNYSAFIKKVWWVEHLYSNVKTVHFILYRPQTQAEFGNEDHITRLSSQWMLHFWR